MISIKLQLKNTDNRNKLITLPTDQSKCFTVYYAKRCDKTNKWRPYSTTFHSNDTRTVNIWFKTIQDALNGKFIKLETMRIMKTRENRTFLLPPTIVY